MRSELKLFGIISLLLFSCVDNKQELKSEKEIGTNGVNTSAAVEKNKPKITIDSTEIQLKNFMINTYVKDDMKFLTEVDHKFQYENIDLNGDEMPETFVRFSSPYYCGSGGCTFLLLDNQQKVITKFTVMEAPIYVEEATKNGWAVLLVKDRGFFKELTFNGKKYPSNPSILPKAPYDAPSGNTSIIFEKPFAESKICTF